MSVNPIFEQIEKEEKKQQAVMTIEPGKRKAFKFDVNKIEIVDTEYEGKKQKKVQYKVIDAEEPFAEKTLRFAFVNAKQLNSLLKANITNIVVERTGSGKQTRYTFAPGGL